MARSWAEIQADLIRRRVADHASPYREAQHEIERLVDIIAEDRRYSTLFGWLSMHELCVQQADVAPHTGPYLRLSPLQSGAIEFRYFDTAIRERQWSREVPAAAAMDRLRAFFEQLHWF